MTKSQVLHVVEEEEAKEAMQGSSLNHQSSNEGSVDEPLLQQLLEMNFDKQMAIQALLRFNNDINLAVDFLCMASPVHQLGNSSHGKDSTPPNAVSTSAFGANSGKEH
jgi:uncharacterized UBP type Zn finger protein